MIRVSRSAIPASLKTAAAIELPKVLAFYGRQPSKSSWKFTAYREPAVAAELKRLFHKKCAYCESKMMTVQPIDVDHFRPKNAIRTGRHLIKPGYYWLAGSWNNLLPSCILCNRPNRYESGGVTVTGGKGNDFPLMGTTLPLPRYAARSRVYREPQLLLDPCGKVPPSKHLRFFHDGKIEPKPLRDGTPSPRGKATIKVFALDRTELCDARRDVALRIIGELERLEEEMQSSAGPNGARRRAYHLRALARHLTDDQPYLEMARQLIEARQPGFLTLLPDMLRYYWRDQAPPLHNFKRRNR
ncbi:hypothetical protein HFO56_42755 [Rhizobium laguerreae]|uniref:hypothetical protein n=1 Tax=Rhizobium laguerreae TaxID=1076926 RepID=UPI001C917755|nr:hypothetical protein [Rhizobium laguerreae]MBY3158992.1 hypothetical protein [Rhizobium laguerreae]